MCALLYVYDIKNLKLMKETMSNFQFFSIGDLLHLSNTVEELIKMDADDIDHAIIDITNLIKDGTYYRIFTERYLRTLNEHFESIHFSLQTEFLVSFKEWFPYFFDDEEINYDFKTNANDDVVLRKEIKMHPPLSLFVYKNQEIIKKLYKNESAISLSNLMEECESIVFKYNLENISCAIMKIGIKYIDLSSIIKTLKLRRDLTFQFEILIHQIASANNVKYSLEYGLAKETIELFPFVFSEEQIIDDCIDEAEIRGEELQRIDVDKLDLLIQQINEKLKGHIAFKNDFKHNILKFTFLNKMNERKILSLLLCGDSGIGKTEFAKIVSNIIYPDEPLIKINFGNYSTEGVLNSLIGSPLGYYGSEEGGELINKISTSRTKIILIDEFEKATSSVFNFFYELLEDGKFTDRHGTEHNLNGYIIIFTSNMTEKYYQKYIPDSLKSRFDMVYNFEDLPVEDKMIYINNTTINLIEKLKEEFDVEVDIKFLTKQLNELVKYKNLRDMKREIEDLIFGEFFKYYKS